MFIVKNILTSELIGPVYVTYWVDFLTVNYTPFSSICPTKNTFLLVIIDDIFLKMTCVFILILKSPCGVFLHLLLSGY